MRLWQWALLAAVGILGSITVEHASISPSGRPQHSDREISLPRSDRKYSALWLYTFPTIDAMVRGVHVVVAATAVGTRPGRIVASTRGELESHFEQAYFTVDEVLKAGDHSAALASGSISVERLGYHASKGIKWPVDVDGGSFEVGKRYVLFLRGHEDGSSHFLQINHEGRYDVSGLDVLVSNERGSVADKVNGKSLAWLRAVSAQLR